MPEQKVATDTPVEDAQQPSDVRDALPPESAQPKPDEREDDPVLVQIGPTDI